MLGQVTWSKEWHHTGSLNIHIKGGKTPCNKPGSKRHLIMDQRSLINYESIMDHDTSLQPFMFQQHTAWYIHLLFIAHMVFIKTHCWAESDQRSYWFLMMGSCGWGKTRSGSVALLCAHTSQLKCILFKVIMIVVECTTRTCPSSRNYTPLSVQQGRSILKRNVWNIHSRVLEWSE